MSERLRVCHLVHHLATGGLEYQLLRIIRASEESVDYTVCYLEEDDSLRAELEAAGARVVRLDTRGEGIAARFAPWNVARLVAFLRREGFDLLHCHTSLYLHVLGRVAGRAAGLPVVGTYHNTSENFHPAMRALERLTRPLSAVNVAVSKDVERTFAADACEYQSGAGGALDRATCTVYNGIDVDGFRRDLAAADPPESADGDGGVTFLSVGRYAPEKNQRALIRSMPDVIADLPEAHLYLVGWGPLEDDLRETAADLGIGDRVTVTGRVPSVHGYYALADAFVLPSSTEGLSVVLLEAMAAGLPVVSTDVAGTAEAVVDGETGYVVPPGDREAMAAAMVSLGATDRRRRMGERGRTRAEERFAVSETARSYVDIYRRVASTSRR